MLVLKDLAMGSWDITISRRVNYRLLVEGSYALRAKSSQEVRSRVKGRKIQFQQNVVVSLLFSVSIFVICFGFYEYIIG